MPVGFRINPTIHYYWFAVLIPWFRFLFLSCKPNHDDQQKNEKKKTNHDDHDHDKHDHHDCFDYDVEAQMTMNRPIISSAEGRVLDIDSDRSISDISFSSSSSLTFTRCRFRDSFHSSNSSDGSPSSVVDTAPFLNESFHHSEDERVIISEPSPSSSAKLRSKSRGNSIRTGQIRNQKDGGDFLHPVTKILREQELAKQILGLAIPMAMGLMAYYNPMAMTLATRVAFLLLSVGFAALWNGNLLHETYPGFSHKIELLGYACMLTAFYSLVAYYLRFTYLALVPVICLILSLVPLGMAFCNRNFASANLGSNIHK